MRHSSLISSAAVAISAVIGIGAASAADLPARTYTKAVAVSPVYNWGGFYVGLDGGGGSAHDCWTASVANGVPIVPPANEGCHNPTGGLAGGQIGYRWQRANLVLGVEAQGDWANLRGSNTSLAPGFSAINQTKINALGLFTGQVGYAWNNVLWYAKGGAAVTSNTYNGISTTALAPGFPVGSLIDQATETRWGGALGTGLEFGFAPGWTVGVEYEHLFMGTKTVTGTYLEGPPVGTPSRTDSISQSVDIGLVRVNYTFGGPVVAKY
jgi:outer membrane immunogenic protein